MVDRKKESGAYYTPPDVVDTLIRWATRNSSDRLLDPSAGDGRFLARHPNSVGVEHDACAAAVAMARAPTSTVHIGDFFEYARHAPEKFDCAAGNPPFIRYQRFNGAVRIRALALCQSLGANFSALTSSWAPFLVATASLLKDGGRMAFVVPAEVGHAPYAAPLLQFLASHFERVAFLAIRSKLFSELSEDVWLMYAEGYGGSTPSFTLSVAESFTASARLPTNGAKIHLEALSQFRGRLRPFLLGASVLDLYRHVVSLPSSAALGSVARVGIGYVTGANDFFHLRPSTAAKLDIPSRLLQPAVRNGRVLPSRKITPRHLQQWHNRDDPYLLLRIEGQPALPRSVKNYLDSPLGQQARLGYKCTARTPWYSVPDVSIPDGFMSYMSSGHPALVENGATCAGTNSVHCVTMTNGVSISELMAVWDHPFTHLSCEIEGHPLGGGMLKLEPREAQRVCLARPRGWPSSWLSIVEDGLATMRTWRHSSG